MLLLLLLPTLLSELLVEPRTRELFFTVDDRMYTGADRVEVIEGLDRPERLSISALFPWGPREAATASISQGSPEFDDELPSDVSSIGSIMALACCGAVGEERLSSVVTDGDEEGLCVEGSVLLSFLMLAVSLLVLLSVMRDLLRILAMSLSSILLGED